MMGALWCRAPTKKVTMKQLNSSYFSLFVPKYPRSSTLHLCSFSVGYTGYLPLLDIFLNMTHWELLISTLFPHIRPSRSLSWLLNLWPTKLRLCLSNKKNSMMKNALGWRIIIWENIETPEIFVVRYWLQILTEDRDWVKFTAQKFSGQNSF